MIKHLLTLLFVGGMTAGAQQLPDGTEILLTDSQDSLILGHGTVDAGHLIVSFSEVAQRFHIRILQPNGSFEWHEANWTEDARLLIEAGGRNVNFADYLDEHEIYFIFLNADGDLIEAVFDAPPQLKDNGRQLPEETTSP